MPTIAPTCLASIAVALAAPAGPRAGDVVLENARFRAVLGADARWRSLKLTAGGRELLAGAAPGHVAVARVDGKDHRAVTAALTGDRLTVGFAGCDTKLVYSVARRPDWVALRLVSIAGARPSRLTLLRLPVAVVQHVGPRLNGAWDERAAVCLTGLGLHTGGRGTRRGSYAELACATQDAPGPKLEGAAAAVVAAPTREVRGVLRRLADAHDLPRNVDPKTGVPSKELPLARQSYWFLRFGEKDADRVIDLCRRTGFRQVMMLSHSWCRTVGHYTFRTDQYRDGVEGLRRTVRKLHDAGILVGMHCYASKVSKTDAYVTPVPDPRFWTDRRASLAAGVGPRDTRIVTDSDLSQWPGSAAAKQKTWEGGVTKHQEVIVGDEIIRYESIGPAGAWNTFVGCRRGAWGTKAAAHQARAPCRHYAVDGCINGYIIDQETSLLAETTDRLARIFTTCGFDMVYFDGGEDVDRRRFAHYVSKFQAVAMGKFRGRPLVHMGTILTHNLWHSFTRSGTVDTYLNTLRGRIISGAKVDRRPTVREHIDRSVAYMLSVRDDMMPGELGWFGIWPKGEHTDGLQLDEIEYLMGKSLAYDAPISLQTSFGQMDRHPLTDGILEIVGTYERLRLSGAVSAAARARLRPLGRDSVLLRRGEGVDLVEAKPLAPVAGGREVRAMVGALGRDSVAAVWHHTGEKGRLLLTPAAGTVEAVDVAGKAVALTRTRDGLAVPIGGRRTVLIFPGVSASDVRKLLAQARFRASLPAKGASDAGKR